MRPDMRRTHGLLIVAAMAIWIVSYGLAIKANSAQAAAENAQFAALEAQESADKAGRRADRAVQHAERRRGWWPF
jgi:hypothetical protein